MIKKKVPILLLTNDRPNMLEKVLRRIIKYTNWNEFELWILDNFSTKANKKIINVFKSNYPFINIFSTSFNQLSIIQNEAIKQLKSDIYIKIDDDILVSENWTTPLVEVFNRNYTKMSYGSVIIPINSFGWIPFMEIMNYKEEFVERFPNVKLVQNGYNAPIFHDEQVNEFIWNKCIDIDSTARKFLTIQNGEFKDFNCTHKYSIGTIIFSHKTWEDMGGWQVESGYDKVLKKQKKYQKLADTIKKYSDPDSTSRYTRLNMLADVFSGANRSELGHDEHGIFEYTRKKGLSIPVTTEGIVFHFSYGATDQYLMNKIYLKLD